MDNREVKSMLDMASGAIKERVDIEMPKIIGNILDVNIDPKKARKLTLTLTFTPDSERSLVVTTCEVKTQLAPTNPVVTSLYVGEFNGEVQAVEMKPQVPGQIDIYGGETEQPAKLKLIKKDA